MARSFGCRIRNSCSLAATISSSKMTKDCWTLSILSTLFPSDPARGARRTKRRHKAHSKACWHEALVSNSRRLEICIKAASVNRWSIPALSQYLPIAPAETCKVRPSACSILCANRSWRKPGVLEKLRPVFAGNYPNRNTQHNVVVEGHSLQPICALARLVKTIVQILLTFVGHGRLVAKLAQLWLHREALLPR